MNRGRASPSKNEAAAVRGQSNSGADSSKHSPIQQGESTSKEDAVKQNPGRYEDRRGWASCFAAEKTEDWQADFTGVIVLENGEKYWVNVYKRLTKKRERFVSVGLRPHEGKAG